MSGRFEDTLSLWWGLLDSSGFRDASLLSTTGLGPMDSCEAFFRSGTLVLRLVRDRGQDFVEVAPADDRSRVYQLDDLGVAQGWRRLEDVLARTEPIPIQEELVTIASRRHDLEEALGRDKRAETDRAAEAAAEQRSRAFLMKWQRSADEGTDP